ncbi:hypothetical protein EI555_019629, partial [Monodon monoceros]
RNTPGAGGRCSAWVRNWAIRRHIRDRLPISVRRSGTLVKSTDPDPSWNYLFGFHPQGVLVSGACSNFCTEATGFSHLFPHLQPHLLTLPCWFQLPVFRDYIMCAGSVPSDKASASYLLSLPGGLLAVGGPLEAWEAKPGALSLRIRNQKRFVKLALEEDSAAREGAQRAPGGLIQQFPNPPGSWVRRTQEALQPLLRVALPLFHGPRGLLLPFRTPIHTVGEPRPLPAPLSGPPACFSPAEGPCTLPAPEREVGAPITAQRTPRPSRAQVDAQHEVYLERLKQLLKEHMARSGVPADRHPPPPRRAAGPHRCPRTGANGSLHSPAALPQYENPEEAAARTPTILSAYCYVRTLLFTGPFCSLLFLLFTSLWYFSVLYLVWVFLDRDTHPAPQLPPDRNYLLVAHPHGIMAMGILCNFSTESSSFSQQFPRLRPLTAMLNGLFHFPGAHESLYAIPGEHCLTVQNRKGFVHLALRRVTSLVPLYSFGENDIFRKMLGFKKLLGFSPCIFWGCGLFSADSWGLGPFSRPMTTVVGCPIPVPQCLGPTEEQVDHSHMLYVKALEQLFDEHKESCSVPASTRPTFI